MENHGLEAQLHGGGVEGDMLFAPGADPKSSARGVGINGNSKWPNGEIPYDLSAITGTTTTLNWFVFILFDVCLDSKDQQTITTAMNTLMYAVGTPISGSTQRTACVYFRPRTSTDKVYLKVQYGNGCSANVCIETNVYKRKIWIDRLCLGWL